MSAKAEVLITGASSGIGATYADRFARRGHDLILAARDVEKMESLAAGLMSDYGVSVGVVRADLTDADDVRMLEARIDEDKRIGILVNNAGATLPGGFTDQSADAIDALIRLNVTAVTRLAHAAARRFADEGQGAIINIASVVGLAPEFGMSVYGATKAFVTYLSQSLRQNWDRAACMCRAYCRRPPAPRSGAKAAWIWMPCPA